MAPDASTERAAVDRRFKEKSDGLLAWLVEQLTPIAERYPNVPHNPIAYSYLDYPTGVDPFARYLHWERHHESLQDATIQDARGDLGAYRRLVRTAEDYRRVQHRKGPIKAFQGDVVHREFLELVICFEIEPLTADELAECADEFCGCGRRGGHAADALRKQYRRLKKELETAKKAQEIE